MNKQVILIEDNVVLVQYYKELLAIEQHAEVIEMVINTGIGSFIVDIEKNSETKRAYIIDLNLNPKRKEEAGGLEYIHRIKTNLPEVLVIAYSGRHLQEEARKAGANYFFLKEPGIEQDTFNNMRGIILNYFEENIKHDVVTKSSVVISTSEISGQQNINHKIHYENKKRSLTEKYNNKGRIKSSNESTLRDLHDQLAIVPPNDVENKRKLKANIDHIDSEVEKIEEELDEIVEQIARIDKILGSLL
jgi:CheY-like chemotaxis protein